MKQNEFPYQDDLDRDEYLTVSMLREILKKLPSECDDYIISYDSALGSVHKGDFSIYHEDRSISING